MRRALLLLAAISQIGYSQNVTIRHTYYTTVFSESLRIPVVVKWWLTKKMVSCQQHVKRTNKFTADPQILKYTKLSKDYSRSGYDRGHNMSAEDNMCSATGMKEYFYYSNMCPQTPRLNRGIWKSLETYTRELARQNDSVLVWCGSVAKSGRTIGPDDVVVPDYCWKILFIKHERDTLAYVFPHTGTVSGTLEELRVSIDSVERLSRMKFSGKSSHFPPFLDTHFI